MLNYRRTCVKQRVGQIITHLRHCVHRLLFKVQVWLWRLTVIAFAWHANSHLPHKLHFLMSTPTRQRALCLLANNSEKTNLPISSPIDEPPCLCLKYNPSNYLLIIILLIVQYKYFGAPKFLKIRLNNINIEILLKKETGEKLNINEKFFSRIGFNYLIYAIATIAIQFVILNLLGIIDINLLNDFNVKTITSAICNYILPFPLLFWLMNKLDSEKLEQKSLNIKTFLLYLCITFTLMWIGNLIGLAITAAIGNVIQSDIANPVQTLINNTDIWLNLIIISIIGPIFEEIFFRKLLIDRTIKYGAKVSIIVSALLFGFMHGNVNQFFYAFLMGGFFAYVYIKTGKIIYTIILHLSVNLMGSVVSLFVIESANAIVQNTPTPFDIGIVLIYVLILLAMLLFGLIGLSKYKQANLEEYVPKINLEKPLKTIIINPGMLCFIGFCILEMIYVIIAI